MTPSHRRNPPSPETLARIFADCGLVLNKKQTEQFWLYHGLLRRHNPDLNLTRIHNFTNMVLKLYVDSALPARLATLPSPLIDLGTGPGMPGIPLKIMLPELELLLVEGRANRVAFLKEAVAAIGLDGVDVIQRKVTGDFEADAAGLITRAVEGIDQTLARIGGCLRQGGHVYFMKGPGCDQEIAKATALFGDRFSLIQDLAYRIGDSPHQRRLVVFRRLDEPFAARVERASHRHPVLKLDSANNSRFKALKKLLTGRGLKKSGEALMSGRRQIADMLQRRPDQCRFWITRGQSDPPPPESPRQLSWLQLSAPLFKTLDIFGTQGPLLCITAPRPSRWEPQEGFPSGCSLLVPFQDPDNVGAAIRSAAAFGAAQVILLAESAHPYHPKALRSSGGSVPFVRLRHGPSLEDLPENLPILSLSSEGTPINAALFPHSFGLLAGLEGSGLPLSWRGRALCIPMDPAVESLNAAAAVAIALYEWSRRKLK